MGGQKRNNQSCFWARMERTIAGIFICGMAAWGWVNPARTVPVRKPLYQIGPADVLAISVWRHPELSEQIPVRPDGRITLPLIGDLEASGETPQQLALVITSRLAVYLAQPRVTVALDAVHSRSFNVLGRVIHPGAFHLNRPLRVLDALAMAGGFAPFAHKDDLYILRTTGQGRLKRLPVNYGALILGSPQAHDWRLRPGDTVVVP